MNIVRSIILIAGLIFFSHSAFASTLSGGSYTLNGGPTAISSAESSGGTYSEQSTADPASGNSSAGVYATTPAPAAPAVQNSGSQNTPTNNTTNAPPSNTSASTDGTSGQLVMEKVPSSETEASGAGTGSAGPGGETISLTNVRIVRGTPTSITVHFTTSISAIGSVRYSPSTGELTTLTDSIASRDHTFTITNLTPAFRYEFQLAAISETGASTGVYEVTLSPEEIGEEGSSARPVLVPYHSFEMDMTSTSSTSSSTKSSSILHALPPYIYGLIVLLLGIIIGIVWVRRRRSL